MVLLEGSESKPRIMFTLKAKKAANLAAALRMLLYAQGETLSFALAGTAGLDRKNLAPQTFDH